MNIYRKPWTGIIAPLRADNIDTDIIIPKQFLQKITKTGFGRHLFHDWRYLDTAEQQPNTDFILNQPLFQKANILLAGKNFGCGSSREHAVWALMDYGFKAIIANSFSDIFFNNALNNQLLLILLSEKKMDHLFSSLDHTKNSIICTIDVPKQMITYDHQNCFFIMNDVQKKWLIQGWDNIDRTMKYQTEIEDFEKRQKNIISPTSSC